MSAAGILAISVAEIFGDFSYKEFARGGNPADFIKGSAGYVAVIYFLIKLLKTGNVLYVNGMWDGVSALLESVAAYIILGEKLNRPSQYIGLGVIIIGIFILHSGGISK
jgi:multidrug transporter EmrE-like cation transporter